MNAQQQADLAEIAIARRKLEAVRGTMPDYNLEVGLTLLAARERLIWEARIEELEHQLFWLRANYRQLLAELSGVQPQTEGEGTMKIKYTARVIKWRDRTHGNTYHSVRIFDHETGRVLACPMTYGYGDHYKDTALEAMAGAGWLPPKYAEKDQFGAGQWNLYERETGYPINWIVCEGRKRDCEANGRW